MSKSFIVNDSTTTFADNATSYFLLSGAIGAGTQAPRTTPIREAGVFSNLFTYVSANTTLVNSTFTLQKSLADTSVIVTYTSGQTGIKEDTSNTDSFANTDEAAYEGTVANDASGAKTITLEVIGIQFEPTDTSVCLTPMITALSASNSSAAQCFFLPNGVNVFNIIEANFKYRVRNSFTSSNFYAYVSSNASSSIVFTTRKNGAAGNQTVSFGATQTGGKEDITNTDSLVASDDFNSSIDGTGASSVTFTTTSTNNKNTSNQFIELGGTSAGVSVNFNVTTYFSVSGVLEPLTTEAKRQIYPRFDFTAKELISYVSVNTIATSATTVTLRDNGADSSVTVSYAAAETGLKNDTSNTATISSGTDEIDYKIVTPNTSGAITFRWIGMLGETAATASAVTRRRRIRKFF